MPRIFKVIACLAVFAVAAFSQGQPSMGIFLTSPPTLSNGQYSVVQLDSSGRMIVNCASGCGGSGGTSIADEATFTQGTTSLTPIGGLFTSSPAALTTGQTGVVRLTSDRAMFSNIADIAGNTVVTAATGVIKVGLVGNAGAAFDAAQNAAAPANDLAVGGVFNTSPGAITSGNIAAIQVDSKGRVITAPIANACGSTFFEAGAQFLPNASTQLTATATCVSSMLFYNKDTSPHTVTVQDQSTACNTGVCQFLTAYPLAPNVGWVRVPFDGTKFTGGLKWNADAANVVIANVIGNQ